MTLKLVFVPWSSNEESKYFFPGHFYYSPVDLVTKLFNTLGFYLATRVYNIVFQLAKSGPVPSGFQAPYPM